MNLRLVAAALVGLSTWLASWRPADASFTIEFDEVGGDVVATTVGTISLPPTFSTFFSNPNPDFDGVGLVNSSSIEGSANSFGFYGAIPTQVRVFDLSSPASFNFLSTPDSASGDVFGITGSLLFVDVTSTAGGTYSPATTWTWNTATLDSVIDQTLTESPTAVATAAGSFSISFSLAATAIPEPGAGAGLAFVGLAFLSGWRRQRFS
ncbi:MAG: hypothetical protein AAF670_19780 [Planctomycetota bacterium]